MTSYILGDLDISGESHEEESEFASSFEISSNSSAPKIVPAVKQFQEDSNDFQGFIQQ
jgi:hypothetical protein